ncbi:MAG: sugar ABC transporter ATP-binding protein [Geminicoccaceae bacterium]
MARSGRLGTVESGTGGVLTAPRLEVRGVSKAFPGVRALDRVGLIVQAGEIHALLGENGAGKSTLGKIVAGVYAADEGEILLDGASLGTIDEAAAGALGIGIVHQEGSLAVQLSVAENVFAGRQPTGWLGMVHRRAMNERTRGLMRQLGVAIEPTARVASLSPAHTQVVEIAKALSRDLKVLILDEPTAALTLGETARLFEVVRRLAAGGVAVIYVSHRLAEIFELCHRVTVLRDGRVTGTRMVAATDQDELIRLMVGREVHFARTASSAAGPPLLTVEGLAAPPAVLDAGLEVRGGEIVCLAGLVGSGRTELCEAIFGDRRRTAGTVRYAGREVAFSSPAAAIAAGIGMVPEDRKHAGLFLGFDIASNIAVTVQRRLAARGLVDETATCRLADHYIAELRIAATSSRQTVDTLSGGNQQKVMLAKWLAREPRLLIVDEPTRGVDVGARAEIYRIMRALAARGVALLVVSSDLPEVLTLADRIVVMADGRTVGQLRGDQTSEEAVLRLATRFTSVAEVAPP